MTTKKGIRKERGDSSESAKNLWSAVLYFAIRDYQAEKRGSAQHKRWGAKAADWILSDSRKLGSFHWVCRLLSVNPSLVRESLDRVSVPKPPLHFKGERSFTRIAEEFCRQAIRD